jgi:hypothetical protein
MLKISSRNLAEFFAVVGVVLSLLFVGMELRQSTSASRSAAYQELGIATADIWLFLASNRELNDMFFAAASGDIDSFANLPESDKRLVTSFLIGNLRLYETVYLQVEQGLLEPEALQFLGYEGFSKSNLLKASWPEVKRFVDPSFASHLENVLTQ